jgi:hypothetical protein
VNLENLIKCSTLLSALTRQRFGRSRLVAATVGLNLPTDSGDRSPQAKEVTGHPLSKELRFIKHSFGLSIIISLQ